MRAHEVVLFYQVPGLAGARIGRSLDLGLDHAVRMLSRVIEGARVDPSGWWYCEVIR